MRNRAMPRNGESATSFNDLPPEMASYIFLRVPVKTLIISSAVSKTWYSLLKNPSFVSAHISHSISSRNQDAVLIIPTDIRREKYCSLISAETGFVLDKYEIPFTGARLKLVGSDNGLVCLIDDSRPDVFNYMLCDVFQKTAYHNIYMWNPCVRKYRCVVSSCFRKRYVSGVSDVRISFAFGFGFYEPCRDYRVVRIMYFSDRRGKQFGKLAPRVEVFSLRMNKWREIKNSTVVARVASKIGTTVNSTVYWVNERCSVTNSEGVWIMSFDFNSEVFRQIKLPDDVCYSWGEIVDIQLTKFEDSLSVCAYERLTKFNLCCIWLISHEDGIASSTIRFRVVLEKFGQPLNITKGGALLMASYYRGNTSHVLSCNLKGMQYKSFELYKLKGNIQPPNADTFFIESLGGDELLTSAK